MFGMPGNSAAISEMVQPLTEVFVKNLLELSVDFKLFHDLVGINLLVHPCKSREEPKARFLAISGCE